MKHFFLLSIFIATMAISIQSVQAQGKRSIGIRAGYQMSGLFEGSDRVAGTSNYGSFYVGAFKENKIIPLKNEMMIIVEVHPGSFSPQKPGFPKIAM